MKTRELIARLQELDPSGEMECVTLNDDGRTYDEVMFPQVKNAADVMGVLRTSNNLDAKISVIVL